jgi:hypothetical protein
VTSGEIGAKSFNTSYGSGLGCGRPKGRARFLRLARFVRRPLVAVRYRPVLSAEVRYGLLRAHFGLDALHRARGNAEPYSNLAHAGIAPLQRLADAGL